METIFCQYFPSIPSTQVQDTVQLGTFSYKVNRNLNKERYSEDQKILQLLVKGYESTNRKNCLKQLEPLHKSAYRNIRFISKLISTELTSTC
ncbi:MAG: hypothetical protein ABI199_08070 [Bacteroidia bacterium]